MDTAGVDGDRIQLLQGIKSKSNSKHAMERDMMEQTLEAAKQSDLVLLMWDAKVGPTQDLTVTARWLRKLGKVSNVAILANKLEGDSWVYDGSRVMEHIQDVSRLGLGEPIPISALQGEGIADIAILIEQLKAQKAALYDADHDNDDVGKGMGHFKDNEEEDEKPLQMAVLGRQNVGKSTLVNTLLQSERVLAGPTPGLTRDAIAVEWAWDGTPIQLVDTAGIRKMTKRMDDSIEDMSVADALRAMKVAEVAVLVLDAEELFLHRQEIAICNAILEEGRALVIAANKMDLLEISSKYTPQDFADGVRAQLEERMPILRNTPIVPMSCVSGKGVDQLLPVVMDAKNRWEKTFSTSILNRWLREVLDGARPPRVKGVSAKLKYIIQTKGRPPTFIIFSNVDELPDSYLRYLTRHFQDAFELYGMPVRIVIKKSAKENPYNKEPNKRGGFGLGGREGRQRRRTKLFAAKTRKAKKKSNQ
jgi:GTP-binding protein